jgi:hypothetical protein
MPYRTGGPWAGPAAEPWARSTAANFMPFFLGEMDDKLLKDIVAMSTKLCQVTAQVEALASLESAGTLSLTRKQELLKLRKEQNDLAQRISARNASPPRVSPKRGIYRNEFFNRVIYIHPFETCFL